MKNRLVSIDIGTSKVTCLIGDVDESGKIRVKGVGKSERSDGVRKGMIINIEKTYQAIKEAVDNAERIAGVKVEECVVNITGEHIDVNNQEGVIAVENPGDEITPRDVRRVIEHARAIRFPQDRDVIHMIPVEFTVDSQTGIKDPVGMAGFRLKVDLLIITGYVSAIRTVKRTVERAGIKVKDIVLQGIADTYALLDEESRETGVAVIDIGAGTTDVVVIKDGSVKFVKVLPVGGDHITNDIMIGLQISAKEAEKIKKEYGIALSEFVGDDEVIKIPATRTRAEKHVKRKILADIMEPRVEEILVLVETELSNNGLIGTLGSGVILTGGTVHIEKIETLAERIFARPVRIGKPEDIETVSDIIFDPMYTTGVGLLMYQINDMMNEFVPGNIPSGNKSKFLNKLKKWWENFF